MSAEARDKTGVIRRWWTDNLADRQAPRARALSARLRRADPLAALAEPEVHELARALVLRDGARLSRLVRVLAQFRSDLPVTLPRRLGGAEPVLSNLRFRRLLLAEGEDLALLLIRAAPMAERACHIGRLGRDLLAWNDRTRARWAFDYFAAPVPERLEESSE